MSKNKYLIDSRLPEVLALIQVLAYDKKTCRSESGIANELQKKPVSADSWVSLAKDHLEFFRVRQENEEKNKNYKVSLVSRYVLERASPDEYRPALDSNTVNKLMEIAIEIHDRQIERRDRWKFYVPVLGLIFASAMKIII